MNSGLALLAKDRQRDIEQTLRRRSVLQLARRTAAACRRRILGLFPVTTSCEPARVCPS
jgi:hypothetical protein